MTTQDTYKFSFVFFDESTEQEKEYSFNIYANNLEQVKGLEMIDRCEDDVFGNFVSQMEMKYGIHNAAFGEKDFSFNTYEVEADKYEELMKKWQEFFLQKGYRVGEIVIR